ncbi:MAG: Rrf2 family transcriptional regulator [Zetaproteobacteria bacterium]|nr:MAG: Rrf2 family transcriptional regulator [Zetaproteobacteria bacterium]
MRLTSKGRYAVSAMVDLTKHQYGGPVNLAAISERQFISLSYLEQLFRRLRESGLVKSVRGPGGGYLLNREPSEISVAETIRAVDEQIRATLCVNALRGCHRGHRCDTHELWDSLGQHIYRFLDVVTLEDVCEKRVHLDTVELAPVDHYLQAETPESGVVMHERAATVS